MTDLLLPATDGDVLAQAVGAASLCSIALWVVRHDGDLRWLVGGLATATAGLMAPRIAPRPAPRASVREDGRVIRVRILHVDDCPGTPVAVERVAQAVTGRDDVAVAVEVIRDADAARRAGLRGSPTILVDGQDPFGVPGTPTGLSCRVVPGGDPVPSVAEIEAALDRAAGTGPAGGAG